MLYWGHPSLSLLIAQVVLVELCKDRVGLMLNPDGPKGVQLWTSRQMSVSGLPKSEGWPSQKEILQGEFASSYLIAEDALGQVCIQRGLLFACI